jgi:hypothetical protein
MKNTLSDHGNVNRGVCKVSNHGFLVDIVETLEIEKLPDGAQAPEVDGKMIKFTGDEIVSMNLWGFKPSCFSLLEQEFERFIGAKGMDLKSELLIPSSVDKFVKSGEITIQILMSNERWFGVTYRDDKPFVVESIKNMIAKGVYPSKVN